MKRQGFIRKSGPQGIDLDALRELARRHASLRGPEPTTAINPFTKKPVDVLPKQTQVRVLAGEQVIGRIEHATSWPGELDVFGDDDEVLAVAREVAETLDAELVAGTRPPVAPKELERILEGLDGVDWASLSTPCSPSAERVPVLLRAAVSRQKAAREDAQWELTAEFVEVSWATSAGVALLPILIALLKKNVPGREVIAGLVASLLRDNEAADVERHVAEAFPLIAPFLRAETPDVRATVAGALEAFPTAAKPWADALASVHRAEEKERRQPVLPTGFDTTSAQRLAIGIGVLLFALSLHLTGARPVLIKLGVAAVGVGILIVWFVTRQRPSGGST